MCYGNVCQRNPVILEFESFQNFYSFEPKSNYGSKKEQNDKLLVKVEYNLECGNI